MSIQSVALVRDDASSNRHPALSFFEHDLVGKPVPTFPDHALASDIIGLKARSSRRARGGELLCVVLSTVHGIDPEHDNTSHRRRRGRAGIVAGTFEHDARRIAEPVPEADANAGVAAIRGDCHNDARGLGDGPLGCDKTR